MSLSSSPVAVNVILDTVVSTWRGHRARHINVCLVGWVGLVRWEGTHRVAVAAVSKA